MVFVRRQSESCDLSVCLGAPAPPAENDAASNITLTYAVHLSITHIEQQKWYGTIARMQQETAADTIPGTSSCRKEAKEKVVEGQGYALSILRHLQHTRPISLERPTHAHERSLT
jgi:hypothetical protein